MANFENPASKFELHALMHEISFSFEDYLGFITEEEETPDVAGI